MRVKPGVKKKSSKKAATGMVNTKCVVCPLSFADDEKLKSHLKLHLTEVISIFIIIIYQLFSIIK